MKKQGIIIGLTGNIACGKSQVATLLRSKGIPVIDADQLVDELYTSNDSLSLETQQKIKNEFSTIDKNTIRDIIFKDSNKRTRLESILHPIVRKLALAKAKDLIQTGHKIVIYEAPLLFESGVPKEIKDVLVISCNESLQLERLLKRNSKLTKESALNIIRTQMDQEIKKKNAKWVIINNSDLNELETQVFDWLKTVLASS